MGEGGRGLPDRHTMPRTAELTESQTVHANLVGFQVKLPITMDA